MSLDTSESLDFQGSYMSPVHDDDHLYETACRHLAGVDFDTLVGTGLSGTIAVIKLSKMLGKKYLLIRKPNDGSHSSQPAEGSLGKRWVFVDDLISSGRTFARVWNKIDSFNFDTEFVGSFLYGTDGSYDDASWRDVERMCEGLAWKCADYVGVVERIRGVEEVVEEPFPIVYDAEAWKSVVYAEEAPNPPNPMLPVVKVPTVSKKEWLMDLYRQGVTLRSIPDYSFDYTYVQEGVFSP